MEYIRSKKYETKEWMSKIMGPNPIKLEEELLSQCKIPKGAVVCDFGSGQGLTSGLFSKRIWISGVCSRSLERPKGEQSIF